MITYNVALHIHSPFQYIFTNSTNITLTFQAIWSIVKKKGMATAYSDPKTYPKFGSFVRAVIGLPYCPLERLDEAMRILERMARATTGSRRSFCQLLLKYLRNTWLDGSIPREVWNMYEHQGVTTNNHAEVCHLKHNTIIEINSIYKCRLLITRWVQNRRFPSTQIHMFW